MQRIFNLVAIRLFSDRIKHEIPIPKKIKQSEIMRTSPKNPILMHKFRGSLYNNQLLAMLFPNRVRIGHQKIIF